VQDVMDSLKALGDENRVRILLALQDGELCVCQVIELLALAASTVSKHLSILRSARLVESRKDGRWMYYQLSKKTRFAVQAQLFQLVSKAVHDSSQASADRKALSKIRKEDLAELCQKSATRNRR
jgi:ArsR family transcriptional regulator